MLATSVQRCKLWYCFHLFDPSIRDICSVNINSGDMIARITISAESEVIIGGGGQRGADPAAELSDRVIA